METTCGSLLSELQKIWDEIGEPETERDRMILELEQECLQLYRRKVDQTSRFRAQLRQAVADAQSELASICAALGERPLHIKQNSGSLKMELQTVSYQLEEIQKRKKERENLFTEVLEQINHILKELASNEGNQSMAIIDDTDLSLKKLEDLKNQLHDLEREKSKRLKQVQDHLTTLNSLCLVLGLDFKFTVKEIHPTLDDSSGAKSISLHTIEKLSIAIQKLKDLKIQRVQKLQDLAATMVELWCLMDTPVEEQQRFQNVTRNIAASVNEITEPKSLALDFIQYAEAEVSRLQEMKSSKIKEVLLKKKVQLEQICREAHMVVDAHNSIDYTIETIESGTLDPSYLLEQIEVQISKVKEEAFSRKEILDKVEKWWAACEEECWLEEYNRDDNRYNAGRGTHLVLKRAEKARALVNKIPAMVESLTSKVKAWEEQRGVEFLYDGVGLLSMLDQYCFLKQEKVQERQRERDQKKLHGQLLVEQEALFGSKPSPTKSGKKNSGTASGASNINKRFSVAGTMLQNSHPEKAVLSSQNNRSNSLKQHNSRNIQQSRSAVLSSGKRDISRIPSKKPSYNGTNTHSTESKSTRKPLSPIYPLSYKTNSANIQDEEKKNQQLMDALCCSKAPPMSTPNKRNIPSDGGETPKMMPIPMPTTPSTVSITMQMAMTPATPYIHSGNNGDMEYSFEERRAGFIVSKSHQRSLVGI